MASYEYLISSLPMLKADGEMPFSYDEFLEMCKSSLREKRYQALESLDLSTTEGPLMDKWAKFYGVLAEELTYQRNLRLGRPCDAPADRDQDTIKTVTAALNAKNPLEAEVMLLSLEFDKLDSLVSMHYFDDYVLNGYALKLKLLERQTIFEKAAGRAEFSRLMDTIQQQVLSI